MSKCNFNYGLVYVRKPRVIGQDYCIALGWSISQGIGAVEEKLGRGGGGGGDHDLEKTPWKRHSDKIVA